MGLRQDILKQPVSELDLREVLVVKPGDTVRDVVQLMRKGKLGCVIIVDQGGSIVGKFTERRLIHLLLTNPGALDEPVADHGDQQWDCVKSSDPIAEVLERMESKKLRFICVTDEAGKPIGLTGQKGLVEFMTDYFPRQVKVQETESKLYMDQREGA